MSPENAPRHLASCGFEPPNAAHFLSFEAPRWLAYFDAGPDEDIKMSYYATMGADSVYSIISHDKATSGFLSD